MGDPFTTASDRELCGLINASIGRLISHSAPREYLAQVCTLHYHERLFWSVDVFNIEASCEGEFHYFYYSSGDLLEYTLLGLEEIGAHDIAHRLRQYVTKVFGESCPASEEDRQAVLRSSEALEEQASQTFAYRASDEKRIVSLLANWARRNREHLRLDTSQRWRTGA